MIALIQLTFAVTGTHCASCGLLIDDAVEEVDGVVASSTDVRKHLTTVTAADETDPDRVIQAIAELGYEAQQLDNTPRTQR